MRSGSQLVLASNSPRRRELLTLTGIPFTVVPSTAEEIRSEGESPTNFVKRVARDKGLEVASRIPASIVLSADTIVMVDGYVFGKPAGKAEAVRMLERLSDKQHTVLTAVTVLDSETGAMVEGLEETKVWFRNLDPSTIDFYIRREDVMDKAGAYAIQGCASVFIPKIEGSYSNVVGLPLSLTCDLLSSMGLSCLK